MNKIKWPVLPQIRRTPLTRIAAALAALVLIAALILVVDRQVGNPFSARWTVHVIKVMQYERQIFIGMFLLLMLGVFDTPLYWLNNGMWNILNHATAFIDRAVYMAAGVAV